MLRSLTTVFGDPEDFQAALSAEGVVRFLPTDRGRFRARVTQILLHNLRLTAGEEELARIAFVAVPPGTVLVMLTIDGKQPLVHSGIDLPGREVVTLGPGQRVHVRTAGPSRWGVIQMPDQDLLRYGRALTGAEFAVLPFARWRPPPAAERNLRRLHRVAVRLVEARSEILTDDETAHGLEQQLIDALIECVSAAPAEEETPTTRRRRDIIGQFEDRLEAEPLLNLNQICTALAVSPRLLRVCCSEHLGMGPGRYLHLCRMQQVHHALRGENPGAAAVSEIARRHGFRDSDHFATNYRAIYGELPSVTLRRVLRPGSGELRLRKSRMKFP